MVWRQLTLALGAAVLGIPLGLGLWWLGTQMGDAEDVGYPSALALLAAAAATVAVCDARHGAAGAPGGAAAGDHGATPGLGD